MSDDAPMILDQLRRQADWHEQQGTSWHPDDIRGFVDAWTMYGRNSGRGGWQNTNAGAVLGVICGIAVIVFWGIVFWQNPGLFEWLMPGWPPGD